MEEFFSDLRKFLRKFDLTNYDINAYLTLMKAPTLSAKEISAKSRVPSGRIYDILERLTSVGLIEVQDTRPKKYKVLKPNSAFRALITGFNEKNQKESQLLYSQARELERDIQNFNILVDVQPPSLFWSTSYGMKAISSLYRDRIRDLEKEILLTGFINEKTIKIIPQARYIFGGLVNFIERNGRARFLWSFDLDERNPSTAQLEKNDEIYRQLIDQMELAIHLSSIGGDFEMKYVNQRISTYFDIFDDTLVLLKLRNPVKPNQIFACISVLDPNLAQELKKYYIEIWNSNAIS